MSSLQTLDPRPVPPPPSSLDEAVATLNDLATEVGLATSLRIGAYLLDAFFGGDPERYRTESSHQEAFRALLRHPDLVPSTSFLWYAIAVHLQYEELPPAVAARLPLSHHRVLLPLRDQDLKLRLAKRAAWNRWSKRELVREVQHRTQRSPQRGRPRLPTFVKGARLLRKALDHVDPTALDETRCQRFGAEQCLEALAALEADLETLTRRAALLRERLERPNGG